MFKSVEPGFSRNSLTFCSHNSDSIYLASVLSISFITLSALSFYILNITPTHADTSATASVTVPSACTLTSTITSGNAHSTTMVAGTFEEDIGTTNLKAICNDPDGLDIYAVGYSSNTLGNTNLVGDNGLNIATGLNTSSSTGNGSSNWAMKLFFPASTDPNANTVYQPNILSDTNGSYAEYHVVPATSTKVASFNAVTDTVVGSNLNTTYRIYLEQNQPAGTYIGQVKYTITHPNTSFSLYMQDFTPEMCNTLGTAVEKYLTVYDKRDNTPYRVGYLPDGRCWMLDNLSLDLVNTSLTDLKGNTNARDLSLEYLKGVRTGTASDQYPTEGVANWTDSSYSIPMIMLDDRDVIPTSFNDVDEPLASEALAGNWKVGGYYNYCATSAGTYCWGNGASAAGSPTTDPVPDSLMDVVEDICPAGWRIPTGGDGGEYQSLATAITDTTGTLTDDDYVAFRKTLFTPLSGDYNIGLANRGNISHFWTSTWFENDIRSMHDLRMDVATVNPTNSYYKYFGFSVRCIQETRTISDIEYMQEINSGIVKNTAVNATTTLKDKRDEKEYRVGKLADGNIWMLDNLAIDLADATVQTNLTSFTTNATNTSIGYLKSGGGTTTDQYATAGVANWATGASYSAPLVNLASEETVPQGDDPLATEALAGNWKVGGYYNYCAASAGSYCWGNGTDYTGSPTTDPNPSDLTDVVEDICPAGWRRPTSDNDAAPYGEYHNLYVAYSSNYTDTREALHAPLSGDYYGGSARSQGSGNRTSSSTWSNAYYMRGLNMNTENIYPSYEPNNRLYGSTIRCIAR